MMNAVAPVTPTATEPSQMNAPKKSPQRNETTPWAIEGGRRWDTSGPYRLAHPGFPQAARSAVEMWKIEFPQVAASTCSEAAVRHLSSPRVPTPPQHGPR